MLMPKQPNILSDILDVITTDENPDNTYDRDILKKNIAHLQQQKLNVLFVGATGVGKSSTINAIFNTEVAKVGYSVSPETASIEKYEINNIVLWDTPGLGDSPENDQRYAQQIANALRLTDSNGDLVIDEVVVLIDGSNRDMKTAYEIIENLVIPYIDDKKRIIIAINQCDMLMKGHYWDYSNNEPMPRLMSELDNKVLSVENRIYSSTGIRITPIYYSALHRYNISKLLLTMMRNMPENKRFLLADSLNKNPDIWKKNDDIENYNTEIQKEVKLSITHALSGAAKGAMAGATVGSFIPVIGTAVGAAVGAALGFLGGLLGM